MESDICYGKILVNHIGFAESTNLHWGYGCMQEREKAKWQSRVIDQPADDMFLQLREAGYSWIFLDVNALHHLDSAKDADVFTAKISEAVQGSVPCQHWRQPVLLAHLVAKAFAVRYDH